MQKWEYQTVWFRWFQPGPDEMTVPITWLHQESPDEMNKLGLDGWECYQVTEDVSDTK